MAFHVKPVKRTSLQGILSGAYLATIDSTKGVRVDSKIAQHAQGVAMIRFLVQNHHLKHTNTKIHVMSVKRTSMQGILSITYFATINSTKGVRVDSQIAQCAQGVAMIRFLVQNHQLDHKIGKFHVMSVKRTSVLRIRSGAAYLAIIISTSVANIEVKIAQCVLVVAYISKFNSHHRQKILRRQRIQPAIHQTSLTLSKTKPLPTEVLPHLISKRPLRRLSFQFQTASSKPLSTAFILQEGLELKKA